LGCRYLNNTRKAILFWPSAEWYRLIKVLHFRAERENGAQKNLLFCGIVFGRMPNTHVVNKDIAQYGRNLDPDRVIAIAL
jgi:hypothetical protein